VTAPAYRRIADRLRDQICSGTYPPGEKLPPVDVIAREHAVSTRTAYEATRLLIETGDVVAKSGAGNFVAVQAQPLPVPRMSGASQDPFTASSEPGPADRRVAVRLGIPVGARAMRTRYVHTPEGRPPHLTTSYEPMALTGATVVVLPEDGPCGGQGVAARMAAIGYPVTRVVEDVGARPLTPDEASLLGARAGIAVVVVERTHYSGEVAVETADVVLPPPYRARYETQSP
jgi:DNA-binding GntR family transcriptional regulator